MPSAEIDHALTEAFRRDWGRVVAALVARTSDLDLAEECAQEAFALATATWPRDGVPRTPLAWLLTTARNRAIDALRREQRHSAALRHDTALRRGAESATVEDLVDWDTMASGIADDRLRLLFTCCHPALAAEGQVALALRTLCGLSTGEIARSFMVAEETMTKRLVRVKQKIAKGGIPYRVPPVHLLPERVAPVLSVLYLLFHEGYAATAGAALTRPELCAQAIELTELVTRLVPDHAEAHGLHALMLLQHARRAARADRGSAEADVTEREILVPLAEQDRTAWDAAAIHKGLEVLRRALRPEQVGPYQLQALIAACHATAQSAEATDWAQIVALYDELVRVVPSPAVHLNRAIALAMRDGPAAGLAELADLPDHPLLPATRADLLRRLGRTAQAAQAYQDALDRTQNEAERAYLTRRLRECR